MIHGRTLIAVLLCSLAFAQCTQDEVTPLVEIDNDILAGGATTVFDATSNAFSNPAPNLSASALEQHLEGDTQFEQVFVTAPATVNSGLGPLYNNTSCISCHPRDGRGRPPAPGEELVSLLFRVSVSGSDEHGGPLPVPQFGTQLQSRSIAGYVPEGSVSIQWIEETGTYADGTGYSLRRPIYTLTGQVPGGVLVSPRIARPVFGLGLLEAIDEAILLALADEADANADGVSGKANMVWDFATNQLKIGRFGWKGNQSTLVQQTAGAYVQDMGVTSPYFALENCHDSGLCDTVSDDPEIDQQILDDVTVYVQTLGVPARRNVERNDVRQGKKIFSAARCGSCHVPQMTTGTHPLVPELSHQTIFPFTDMLLHDMGDWLSDGRPDFLASGSEWRTPPLWGIGLTEVVNGHTFFLHDGRARNLEEAILWHGGEAETAREYFRNLSATNRAAMLAFLRSL